MFAMPTVQSFSHLTCTEQWAISLPRLMPVFSHLMSAEQWAISLPRLMTAFFPFNEHGAMGDLAAAVDARFFSI